MEFSNLLQWPLAPVTTLLALTVVYIYVLYSKSARSNAGSCSSTKRSNNAPVVAGAKPIIGHLHMLMGNELPHQVLGKLADEYGPAYMIRIGEHRELVLSSWELAKECFTTNDKFFLTRPFNKAMKYLTYDQASVGFQPYGPLWVEMRKVGKSNLLSNQRVQFSQKQARKSEFDAFFNELYQLCSVSKDEKCPVPLEMNKMFFELTLSVVTRMVSGKQNVGTKARHGDSEAKLYKRVIDKAAYFTGNLVFSDMFPSLGLLDHLLGHESAMKKTAKELDSIFSSWVEEHQQKRKGWKSAGKKEDEEQDFVDLTLSMMEETNLHGVDADTFVKSLCVAMILGGSDTSSVILTWVLSLLLNHHDVLKKARDEIDQQVGNERTVDDLDLNNLVFLKAVVKEAMRLFQAGPLLEREATEDCTIGGFHVKAGTRILVNIWKVQLDPAVWSDPTEFRPERFLTTNSGIDVKGQHFELIPFGSGRRMCPGFSFALQVIHLAIARLIHSFDLATPMNEKVDLTETSSVTNYKATPLQVLLTPRLASKHYNRSTHF
ncbi:hypothetical protein IFM89_019692 [Coptis chinensis]|uniref:Cytochrome P450 n=1 Tax=Coptis chinensis TaxID=261450 RepID=A0A835H1U7_9MAGN|nr:hypothetical protein IFM89_019692 [Coptis chinensis]